MGKPIGVDPGESDLKRSYQKYLYNRKTRMEMPMKVDKEKEVCQDRGTRRGRPMPPEKGMMLCRYVFN